MTIDDEAPAQPPVAEKAIEADEFLSDVRELPDAALAVFKQMHPNALTREAWLRLLNQFTGRI